MTDQALTIALVAGEASGDQLGAALIGRLQEKYPQARFCGVGGRSMQAAGMDCWWDAQELAVMGLFEVLSHFPRLLRIRRELKKRLSALRPDVFIGIDAPDFNLGLEISLRRQGIKTVHYVSPTVWAWRRKRVRKIARAADLVLCLFPFEPAFYKGYGVSAVFVGHPLADQIATDGDPAPARASLGLEPGVTTIALLPGSRVSEVSRLAESMIGSARLLLSQRPELQFVSAMANEDVRSLFDQTMKDMSFSSILLVDNKPRTAIAAADAVICASGTATLETMLVNRPLVMVYRLATSTYLMVKHLRLIKPQFFSLPNILAGEALVPELLQQNANSENMAMEIGRWLDNEDSRRRLRARFIDLHDDLQCDASGKAARAVTRLLENSLS